MTCSSALVEIWEMLGEPTDLSPYTNPNDVSTFSMTLTGTTALLRALNHGIQAIASYKDRTTGRHYRFRDCIAERYIQSDTTSGTATSASSTSSVVLDTAESAANTLRGALIVCNDENRLIVSNTTAAVVPHKEFSSTTASQDYVIYRRWLDLSGEDTRLYEVLSLFDMEDEQELDRRFAGELAEEQILDTGVPTTWFSTGSRIWFDYHVEDERYYKINFYQLPAYLTSSDETTELPLPEPVHYACILWCLAWGFGRYQDPTMRYSYRKELQEFMRETATQFDVTGTQGRELYGKVVGGSQEG